MNRQLIKIKILIWSLIALMLTGFLVYGIAAGKGGLNIFTMGERYDSASIQCDKSLSLDNCNNISLDFSSAEIFISTTDDNNLRIVEKSSYKLSDKDKFVVTQNGDTILIKDNSHFEFSLFNWGFNKRIELYIPKNYNKNLQIKGSSGDITINSDITLDNADFKLSSGDFNSKNSITANKFTLNETSGDISAAGLITSTYEIKDISGDIDVSNLSGSGDIGATSGDISINYKDISDYSRISTISGDLKLTISKDISFDFNGQCISGDINSNFDLNYKNKNGNKATAKIGEGPYKEITANTTSGDIDISQGN